YPLSVRRRLADVEFHRKLRPVVPLNPKRADLGQLVSGFSDLLRRTLGEDIRLSTVIDGSGLNVLVDSSQLQNAILNIALNARDAMPKGGSL
ncbi:hypothetical protein ACC754_38825, partial [Rhizobium johnstonii]